MAKPRQRHPDNRPSRGTDPLLTYEQVAERLGTTRRLPKRLAEERRITSVKAGRSRRIPLSALEAFTSANTDEAVA